MIKVTKSSGGGVTRLVEPFNSALETSIMERQGKIDARLHIPQIDPSRFRNLTVSKKTVTYQKVDYSGEVKVSDGRSEDLGRIRASKKKHIAHLHFLGIGVELGPDEVDAIEGGDVIPIADTNKAVDIILRAEDKVLFSGYAPLGRIGLANLPGRRSYSVVTGAAGFTWAKKTGPEILKDVIESIADFNKDGKYEANKLLVNRAFWPKLKEDYSDKSSVTIEEKIKALINIEYSYGVVDDSGVEAVSLVEEAPENYGFIEVEAASAQAEYPDKRKTVVPVEEKVSEVIGFNPEAVMYLDGVK
ncbi:hypothetical protein PM10SUCC1_32440 [Propionigenium maris DSM 9537]|uniref:Uncharacterized protein n=1 Tax=Propionigenium maris DSM 9537 TaxID=1123000 RepID=A0A9W6GP39_9FUSO|nr:encapsulin [Propionigenium maris]GLI57730.1 hypothetical protein PM10SUCC1_32440 [Propionigenium maris DSM 9537]